MINKMAKDTSIKVWLRLEGLAVLGLSAALYSVYGAGWLLFGALLLLPDIAVLGYLGGPKVGARVYNLAHTYLFPALLLAAAPLFSLSIGTALALIWFAHIGTDRALGYGLKYPDAFRHTHLSLQTDPRA